MATVARRVGCSKSTVAKTVGRFQETGSNKDRPRAGAPRATTPRDDAYLRLVVRRRPKSTARMFQADWHRTLRRRVSIQTVRNRYVFHENMSEIENIIDFLQLQM